MALAGISTLGMVVAYNADVTNFPKQMPTSVTALSRINAIGGISLSTEQIDASAIEDLISKYVAGRQDTGGTFDVTINVTNGTITEWNAILGKTIALEVYSPSLEKAWWVVCEVPNSIPFPDINQNSLATVAISLVINNYVGLAEKVAVSGS